MKQNNTYRTTLNGTEWMITDGIFGGYTLYMKNYKGEWQYSGYSFKTIEDVQKHLDEIDKKVKNPVSFVPCTDCSSFYGRGSNVYYGD